jgi:hypothetical protein
MEFMKIVGKRRQEKGNLESAVPFLDLVVRPQSGNPFIPEGVHRFKNFENSQH